MLDRIPKPPWYKWIDKKLEGSEWLIDWLLIAIILVSIYLLFRGDRVAKATWAVYVISP